MDAFNHSVFTRKILSKSRGKTTLLFLLAILITSLPLTNCTTIASTGASAVYNRHGIQETLTDNYITMQAYRKIYLDTGRFKNTNVSVDTFHHEVLLTGEVRNPEQRSEVENTVKKIPGIKHLYNLTVISPPSSSLIRISDTWITTKIKTKLLTVNDLDHSQIKVTTQNGTVYLMGTLPPEDAEAAVQVARTTAGVQNVVKVFWYLHTSRKA